GPRSATHEAGRAARRQGLLLPRYPPDPSASRHQGSHSRTSRPAATPPQPRLTRRTPRGLRHGGLPRPQRHRTRLQRREAIARPGHPLRQTRPHLPRRNRPPRHHPLAPPPPSEPLPSIRDPPPTPPHPTTPPAAHWGQAPTGEERPPRPAAPEQDTGAGPQSRTPEQDTRAAERRTNRRRAYPDGSSVGPRPPHSAPGPLTWPRARSLGPQHRFLAGQIVLRRRLEGAGHAVE